MITDKQFAKLFVLTVALSHDGYTFIEGADGNCVVRKHGVAHGRFDTLTEAIIDIATTRLEKLREQVTEYEAAETPDHQPGIVWGSVDDVYLIPGSRALIVWESKDDPQQVDLCTLTRNGPFVTENDETILPGKVKAVAPVLTGDDLIAQLWGNTV